MSNIKTNTNKFYEFMKKYKVGPGQNDSYFYGKPYGLIIFVIINKLLNNFIICMG